MNAPVCSPLTGWQYVVLQNADATPHTLNYLLGNRGGFRTDRPWFNKLLEAGYLEETPPPPSSSYAYYRRTTAGAELAEQLRVMADRLGWEMG